MTKKYLLSLYSTIKDSSNLYSSICEFSAYWNHSQVDSYHCTGCAFDIRGKCFLMSKNNPFNIISAKFESINKASQLYSLIKLYPFLLLEEK